MRAIVQDQFGGPEVLQLKDAPPPKPLPTEIVVGARAVGINPVEAYIRGGQFPLLGQPPFILGWDVAGVVETVVPGVNRFAVGDEVLGMPLFPRAAGAYAELVAAPSRHFVRKPKALSFAEAAALPLVGLTAWQSLVDTAGVKRGDRVLIHAAAGGVGHVAVQIAKALGAHVIATASAEKRDFVRGLGADEVIDYRTTPFDKAVRDIDVVLETVGGDYAERSFATLRPNGLLVTIVDRMSQTLPVRAKELGVRFAGVAVEPDAQGLAELIKLVEAGKLKPHVEQTFPLEQAADAHRFLAGRPKGKVVLTV
ncbi:NADP-dependent oxidoreductase [Terrarubrum flagellatum]|uniref:NADP-dependent oxidoreductase n=1 Tax=Terrirubrum flagellatum TaxID=2895980 RepID=UPI0031450D60